MTVVRQRADGDCGVAALAILAEIAYEDAYVAVSKVDPKSRGKTGLFNREVIAAAGLLGLQLQATRRYDLDHDDGILRIRWNGRRAKTDRGGHFVAIREGLICCPGGGSPMRWREYLHVNRGRPCTLLQDLTP